MQGESGRERVWIRIVVGQDQQGGERLAVPRKEF